MTTEEIATQLTVAWIGKTRQMTGKIGAREIKEVYLSSINAAREGFKKIREENK